MSTEPETIDASSLSDECLHLHYDSFDSLGMEESSLPNDIGRAGASYVAQKLAIDRIPMIDNPDVDIDEDRVDDYAARAAHGEVAPRIVVDSDLNIIDGWHRALGAQQAGLTTVDAWVARVVTERDSSKARTFRPG